jgi:hypothetical protein
MNQGGVSDEGQQDTPKKKEDVDIDFDVFSQFIEEARKIREDGKSMSDEDRREAATSAALRMMTMLGLDIDEEDGFEESEEKN